MKYRKLRIAWSALCGIVCLLLMVCWVRSYRHPEKRALWGRLSTVSTMGRVLVYKLPDDAEAIQIVDPYRNPAAKRLLAAPAGTQPVAVGPLVTTSYWPWVFATGATSIFLGCWPPYRFSIRTLLIAMTVVAVVLGLIVYASGG